MTSIYNDKHCDISVMQCIIVRIQKIIKLLCELAANSILHKCFLTFKLIEQKTLDENNQAQDIT